MRSASWRLPRLRHLPSDPSISLTTTSVCPASFRSATTFDPMNPAPPVTSNISARSLQPPDFRLSRFPWRCRAPRLSRASVIVKPHLGHTGKPLMMKMSNIFSYLTVINVRGQNSRRFLLGHGRLVPVISIIGALCLGYMTLFPFCLIVGVSPVSGVAQRHFEQNEIPLKNSVESRNCAHPMLKCAQCNTKSSVNLTRTQV